MQAVRRAAGSDPGVIADAGMAIAGAGLIAVGEWDPGRLVGTAVAGPPWLMALLPLLMGAPLALRRRAPLLMWLAMLASVALQALVARHPLQSLVIVVLLAGAYSLGAHCDLRRAAAGLIVTAPVTVLISRVGGAHLGLAVTRSWPSGWAACSSAPAGSPRRWPRAMRRCNGRPSRPRLPSAPGSRGNCTTSSPITSA